MPVLSPDMQQLKMNIEQVKQQHLQNRDPVVRELGDLSETCKKQLTATQPALNALTGAQAHLEDIVKQHQKQQVQLQSHIDQAINK